MKMQEIPPVEEVRAEVILQIWNLVNEKYPLFFERGVNWESVKLKYIQSSTSIRSYSCLYKHVDRMLIELKDPHTRIAASPWFQKSYYPIALAYINDDLYIPFDSGESYKLTAGMKITSVNGLPIDLLRESTYAKYPFTSKSLQKVALMNEIMDGDFGDSIEIMATDGQKVQKEVLVRRDLSSIIEESTKAVMSQDLNIPLCLAKNFNDTGYIKILTFKHKNIVQEIIKSLSVCGNIASLVIDVRGNQGGLISETVKIASLFMSKERVLGYRVNSEGKSEAIIVKPLPGIQQNIKRIIVLCDEFTMSSAEFIFINALKGSSNRIQVVGKQTAGLAHEATIFPLFDGTKLQVTTLKYLTFDGKVMDEVGVKPDVEVNNDINFLTRKQDFQLDYALRLCHA